MIAQQYVEDFQVTYLPGTVEIRVRKRPNVKQLIQLGLWLVCWFIVFVLILGMDYAFVQGIFSGKNLEVVFLLLFIPLTIGMIGMGFYGYVGGSVFLRRIAGKEIITADSRMLRIRKTVFGLSRTREYPREQIKAIAMAAPENFPLAISRFNQWRYEVETTGPLYVQYGESKRDFFGFGLDLSQADKIATILKRRLKL